MVDGGSNNDDSIDYAAPPNASRCVVANTRPETKCDS